MKKNIKIFYYNVSLLLIVLLLVGCAGNTNKQLDTDSTENESTLVDQEKNEKNNGINEENSHSTTDSGKSKTANATNIPSEKTSKNESNNSSDLKDHTHDDQNDHSLSKYSSEEIEYARVWLQLGPNQDIDELYVTHISAGTALNPDDDTNVGYPEDVIQIYGSRMVDGMVTYSGNGDGTINLYNIPYRWYGGLSRPDDVSVDDMREQMKEIITHTELISINPGNEEEIINIIHKMNIQ